MRLETHRNRTDTSVAASLVASAASIPVRQPSPVAGWSMVIFSTVDGLLTDAAGELHDDVPLIADWLTTHESALVLVSTQPLSALARTFGPQLLQHPCICDAGAAVWIPHHYFPAIAVGIPGRGGSTIGFGPPYDCRHAVRALLFLYRLSSRAIVSVGLGHDRTALGFLTEVDVPAVVRDDAIDQTALLRQAPAAFLTHAPGFKGWCEALQGSIVE